MKTAGIVLIGMGVFAFTSCKKCAECHYDGPNGEVELGEYCDDDLHEMEENGYVVGDTTYEVHCHEH